MVVSFVALKMRRVLSELTNKYMRSVLAASCRIERLDTDSPFHNYARLRSIEEGRCQDMKKGADTYCGYMKCGVACYVLGNLLRSKLEIEMYMYEFGHGKYREDHVFLKHKDFIIDPTYRQFLTDNRTGPDFASDTKSKYTGLSRYNNYLYSLPPFFVGTVEDLHELHGHLSFLNSQEFEHNCIPKDVLNNWREDVLVTERLGPVEIS